MEGRRKGVCGVRGTPQKAWRSRSTKDPGGLPHWSARNVAELSSANDGPRTVSRSVSELGVIAGLAFSRSRLRKGGLGFARNPMGKSLEQRHGAINIEAITLREL